jgi:NAD(P)H-hydrate epimerase
MQIPSSGVEAMHSSLPEAMVIADSHTDKITDKVNDTTRYNAIGFGPGIDKHKETADVLKLIIQNASQPFIIDADGLNILSENLTWIQFLNGSTILTPHPGEFDRLTHKHVSGIERFKTQLEFSKRNGVYMILKGHHTSITTPSGMAFFNATGNNGMATGGSGDVLTGIITSLCAQGYSPLHACLLGVYLHGYAGDCAAAVESKTSMIASDIIEHIPDFFLAFEK